MRGRVLINLSASDAMAVDRAITERIGNLIDAGDISHQDSEALYEIQKRLAPRIQQAMQGARVTAVTW